MKVLEGEDKKRKKGDPRGVSAQRRGLLAKVHIAKKELGLSDEDYRAILIRSFGVASAKALSIKELEKLVAYFISKGWLPRLRSRGSDGSLEPTRESQLEALRERAQRLASELSWSERQFRWLCRSICGVDHPAWCRDVDRLKRLLAVLENIKWRERRAHEGR